MNQPKDARLLLALVVVTALFGGAASWAMFDWARDAGAQGVPGGQGVHGVESARSSENVL